MIKTRTIPEKSNLIEHYSDENLRIRQVETGHIYDTAVDVIPCRYTYEETDEPIEPTSEEATAEDYEAALAELGVKEESL